MSGFLGARRSGRTWSVGSCLSDVECRQSDGCGVLSGDRDLPYDDRDTQSAAHSPLASALLCGSRSHLHGEPALHAGVDDGGVKAHDDVRGGAGGKMDAYHIHQVESLRSGHGRQGQRTPLGARRVFFHVSLYHTDRTHHHHDRRRTGQTPPLHTRHHDHIYRCQHTNSATRDDDDAVRNAHHSLRSRLLLLHHRRRDHGVWSTGGDPQSRSRGRSRGLSRLVESRAS